jgi:hypothetical protein
MTEEERARAELETAFSEYRGLREIYAIFEAAQRPKADRGGLIAILLGMYQHLNEVAPEVSWDRILYFAAGLGDLDQGKVAPFLQKATKSGAPRIASVEWMRRVPAVLAMECYMRAGFRDGDEDEATPEEQASRKVARSVAPRKAVDDLATSIRGWRDRLGGGVEKNEIALVAFQNGIKNIEESGASPDILITIADRYAQVFANLDEATRATIDDPPSE